MSTLMRNGHPLSTEIKLMTSLEFNIIQISFPILLPMASLSADLPTWITDYLDVIFHILSSCSPLNPSSTFYLSVALTLLCFLSLNESYSSHSRHKDLNIF